jgi:tRNA(Glu) U13 pseudouridine synthase TruD
VPIDKILNVNSKNLFLKNITFGKGVMEKGNLIGNRFTILLRTDHSNIDQETIENLVKKIEQVKRNGFYNFYYLQRFGAPRFINIKWGLEILKGNHKEVIRSFICDSSERELDYFSNLRKKAEKNFGNWTLIKDLFKNIPIICANENIVLDYLIKNPTDFKGALKQIPDQTMLWVYAISSLLFNEKISFLLQTQSEIPEKLPLFLSLDKNDVITYEESLRALNIFPPPFKNLNDFPNIRPEKRLVNTTEKVKINKIEIVEEGIILSFDLSKGDYATTFLSHLFNLVNGKAPEWVSKNILDIKKNLGENENQKTLDHFREMLELRKN